MKKTLLSLSFLFIFSVFFAQEITKRAVFATNGIALETDNQVTVYAYHLENDFLQTLGNYLGDYSGGVVVDKNFAYAHIGWLPENQTPQGVNTIHKYNLATGELLESLEIAYAEFIEVTEEYLIIGKGAGATEGFIEIYDKNNLATGSVFVDAEFTSPMNDLIAIDNKLYISSDEQGIGKMTILDLENASFSYQFINLNESAIGAKDLITDGIHIYGMIEQFDPITSELIFAGIVRFDVSSFGFDVLNLDRANSPITILNNRLIGNFGEDGNAIDLNDFQATQESFLPDYSTGTWDRVNQQYFLHQTDGSNEGKMLILGQAGLFIAESTTEINGASIEMAYNHPPQTDSEELFLFITSGNKHFEILNCVDLDGDDLGLTVTQEPFLVTVDIDGETLIITAPIDGYFDDFIVACFDAWGDFAEITVFVEFGFIGTAIENMIDQKLLNLHPNPATSHLYLDLSAFEKKPVLLQIFDMKKQKVKEESLLPTKKNTIEIKELSAGAYLIYLKGQDKTAAVQFVKI